MIDIADRQLTSSMENNSWVSRYVSKSVDEQGSWSGYQTHVLKLSGLKRRARAEGPLSAGRAALRGGERSVLHTSILQCSL